MGVALQCKKNVGGIHVLQTHKLLLSAHVLVWLNGFASLTTCYATLVGQSSSIMYIHGKYAS